MTFFKSVDKYKEIAKINFKNSFVYIWDNLLGKSAFIALIIFIFSQVWITIFALKGVSTIEGFTLAMMVWYLVIAEAIVTSLGRIMVTIGDEIKSGDIANYLNKPYHYILYKYALTIGRATFTFFVTFIVGGIVAYLTVGFPIIKFYSIPFVFIICFLAITLNFIFMSIFALAAFWIEETSGLYFIYQKLVFTVGGMLVPLEIFPLWLAKIGLILPFSYIAYHPAKLFVMFNFTYFFKTMIIQIAWIIVFICISFFIYSKISKKVSINGG